MQISVGIFCGSVFYRCSVQAAEGTLLEGSKKKIEIERDLVAAGVWSCHEATKLVVVFVSGSNVIMHNSMSHGCLRSCTHDAAMSQGRWVSPQHGPMKYLSQLYKPPFVLRCQNGIYEFLSRIVCRSPYEFNLYRLSLVNSPKVPLCLCGVMSIIRI